MEFPGIDRITALLAGGKTEEAPDPKADDTAAADAAKVAADREAEDAQAAADKEAAKTGDEATRKSEDGAPQEPSVEEAVAALGKVLAITDEKTRERASRRLIESLPEQIRDQFEQALYKGLHRKLSERDSAHERVMDEQNARYTRLESQLEELLTSGMTDDELKVRRERKDAEFKAQRDTAAAASAANWSRALSIVEAAGYPYDPTLPWEQQDSRLLALDWAPQEPDAQKALARLTRSVIAAGPVDGQARTVPKLAAAKTRTMTEEEIEAEVDRRANDKIKRRGLLRADTGRPGGGTSLPGKDLKGDWKATRDEAEKQLVEALGRG